MIRLAVTAPLLAAVTLLGLMTAEESARLVLPVCLAAAGLMLRLEPRLVPGEWFWRLMNLAFLVLFVLEAFVWRMPILFPSVHLLLYLLVNRCHHLDSFEGQRQLLLVSFLTLLAITVLAVELVAGLLLLGWSALAAIHLGALARARARAAAGEPWTEASVPLGPMAWVLAAVLAGGSLVFVAVPRVGAGTLQVPFSSPQHVTGFAAEVSLDDIGRLKTSEALVMRLRHLGGPRPGGPVLLRGTSYVNWDGVRWSSLGRPRMFWPTDGQRYDLEPPARSEPSRFEILLEPNLSGVVFVPSRPTNLRLSRPYALLRQDGGGGLHFDYIPRWRVGYEVWSELAVPDSSQLAAPEPGVGLSPVLFTQLPDGLDPRIVELAREVTSTATEPAEAARLVARHLRAEYGYTLDLGSGMGPDPLAGFLFDKRAGHCELFASAMVVMLRSRGVPARLVNGFVASELNGTGDYFMVRARDAHAWVEVHLPAGWVAFDPTPPEPSRGSTWWAPRRLQLALESLKLGWDRWIISYSAADQQNLLARALEAWSAAGARARGLEGALRGWWWLPLALGAAVGALLLLAGHGRRPPERGGEVLRAYRAMLRSLERLGHAKPASTTPLEFALELADTAPEALEITRIYSAVRFGGRPLGAEGLARLEALLEALSRRP